jgi:hypothetical protein
MRQLVAPAPFADERNRPASAFRESWGDRIDRPTSLSPKLFDNTAVRTEAARDPSRMSQLSESLRVVILNSCSLRSAPIPRTQPLAEGLLSRYKRGSHEAGGSPRLHRRGPIEATPNGLRISGGASRSPRLHRRGPIEATLDVGVPLERPRSPRLHRRGPIEAPAWAPSRSSVIPVLHDFIVVAPLKLLVDGALRLCDLVLHDFIVVAPLKHRRRRGSRRRSACSPRLHRRGPIEAFTPATRSTGSSVVLHDFIVVAPLKPATSSRSSTPRTCSPRLHRRGPIEAKRTCGYQPAISPFSTTSSSWPH